MQWKCVNALSSESMSLARTAFKKAHLSLPGWTVSICTGSGLFHEAALWQGALPSSVCRWERRHHRLVPHRPGPSDIPAWPGESNLGGSSGLCQYTPCPRVLALSSECAQIRSSSRVRETPGVTSKKASGAFKIAASDPGQALRPRGCVRMAGFRTLKIQPLI